jgi:hypothetical protein
MGEGWKRAIAAAKATRPKPSRFKAFNPEERLILETLLQDHANSVSVISASVEGAIDIHAYLATIEALENECKRVR